MRFKYTECLLNAWTFYKQSSRHCITVYWVKQQYTRSVGCNNGFEFGEFRFQLPRSVIQNFVQTLTANIHSYVTTNSFLTLPIYYKLENAKWSKELQFQKRITLKILVCEQHVTVKFYRTAWTLSDADSHFFPNQRNSCSCNLLYICSTTPECSSCECYFYKGNLSRKFEGIWA